MDDQDHNDNDTNDDKMEEEDRQMQDTNTTGHEQEQPSPDDDPLPQSPLTSSNNDQDDVTEHETLPSEQQTDSLQDAPLTPVQQQRPTNSNDDNNTESPVEVECNACGFDSSYVPDGMLQCPYCTHVQYCSPECRQWDWESGGHAEVCVECAKSPRTKKRSSPKSRKLQCVEIVKASNQKDPTKEDENNNNENLTETDPMALSNPHHQSSSSVFENDVGGGTDLANSSVGSLSLDVMQLQSHPQSPTGASRGSMGGSHFSGRPPTIPESITATSPVRSINIMRTTTTSSSSMGDLVHPYLPHHPLYESSISSNSGSNGLSLFNGSSHKSSSNDSWSNPETNSATAATTALLPPHESDMSAMTDFSETSIQSDHPVPPVPDDAPAQPPPQTTTTTTASMSPPSSPNSLAIFLQKQQHQQRRQQQQQQQRAKPTRPNNTHWTPNNNNYHHTNTLRDQVLHAGPPVRPHSSIGSSVLQPQSWHNSDDEEFVEEDCDETIEEIVEDDEEGERLNLMGEFDEDSYSTTEHKETMIDVEKFWTEEDDDDSFDILETQEEEDEDSILDSVIEEESSVSDEPDREGSWRSRHFESLTMFSSDDNVHNSGSISLLDSASSNDGAPTPYHPNPRPQPPPAPPHPQQHLRNRRHMQGYDTDASSDSEYYYEVLGVVEYSTSTAGEGEDVIYIRDGSAHGTNSSTDSAANDSQESDPMSFARAKQQQELTSFLQNSRTSSLLENFNRNTKLSSRPRTQIDTVKQEGSRSRETDANSYDSTTNNPRRADKGSVSSGPSQGGGETSDSDRFAVLGVVEHSTSVGEDNIDAETDESMYVHQTYTDDSESVPSHDGMDKSNKKPITTAAKFLKQLEMNRNEVSDSTSNGNDDDQSVQYESDEDDEEDDTEETGNEMDLEETETETERNEMDDDQVMATDSSDDPYPNRHDHSNEQKTQDDPVAASPFRNASIPGYDVIVSSSFAARSQATNPSETDNDESFAIPSDDNEHSGNPGSIGGTSFSDNVESFAQDYGTVGDTDLAIPASAVQSPTSGISLEQHLKKQKSSSSMSVGSSPKSRTNMTREASSRSLLDLPSDHSPDENKDEVESIDSVTRSGVKGVVKIEEEEEEGAGDEDEEDEEQNEEDETEEEEQWRMMMEEDEENEYESEEETEHENQDSLEGNDSDRKLNLSAGTLWDDTMSVRSSSFGNNPLALKDFRQAYSRESSFSSRGLKDFHQIYHSDANSTLGDNMTVGSRSNSGESSVASSIERHIVEVRGLDLTSSSSLSRQSPLAMSDSRRSSLGLMLESQRTHLRSLPETRRSSLGSLEHRRSSIGLKDEPRRSSLGSLPASGVSSSSGSGMTRTETLKMSINKALRDYEKLYGEEAARGAYMKLAQAVLMDGSSQPVTAPKTTNKENRSLTSTLPTVPLSPETPTREDTSFLSTESTPFSPSPPTLNKEKPPETPATTQTSVAIATPIVSNTSSSNNNMTSSRGLSPLLKGFGKTKPSFSDANGDFPVRGNQLVRCTSPSSHSSWVTGTEHNLQYSPMSDHIDQADETLRSIPRNNVQTTTDMRIEKDLRKLQTSDNQNDRVLPDTGQREAKERKEWVPFPKEAGTNEASLKQSKIAISKSVPNTVSVKTDPSISIEGAGGETDVFKYSTLGSPPSSKGLEQPEGADSNKLKESAGISRNSVPSVVSVRNDKMFPALVSVQHSPSEKVGPTQIERSNIKLHTSIPSVVNVPLHEEETKDVTVVNSKMHQPIPAVVSVYTEETKDLDVEGSSDDSFPKSAPPETNAQGDIEEAGASSNSICESPAAARGPNSKKDWNPLLPSQGYGLQSYAPSVAAKRDIVNRTISLTDPTGDEGAEGSRYLQYRSVLAHSSVALSPLSRLLNFTSTSGEDVQKDAIPDQEGLNAYEGENNAKQLSVDEPGEVPERNSVSLTTKAGNDSSARVSSYQNYRNLLVNALSTGKISMEEPTQTPTALSPPSASEPSVPVESPDRVETPGIKSAGAPRYLEYRQSLAQRMSTFFTSETETADHIKVEPAPSLEERLSSYLGKTLARRTAALQGSTDDDMDDQSSIYSKSSGVSGADSSSMAPLYRTPSGRNSWLYTMFDVLSDSSSDDDSIEGISKESMDESSAFKSVVPDNKASLDRENSMVRQAEIPFNGEVSNGTEMFADEHADLEAAIPVDGRKKRERKGGKGRKKGRKRVLMWALCVCFIFSFVAVVVTGLVMAARKDDSESPSSSPTENSPTATGPSQSPSPSPTISNAPTAVPTTEQTFPDQDLLETLTEAFPDGAVQLRKRNSPQNQAYFWMIESSTTSGLSNSRLIQRYVLATLYFSTNGEAWENNTGWLSDDDECNWFSSSASACDNGILVSLHLELNKLHGELPDEIGMLSNLREILFRDNDLFGSVPDSIGDLTQLQTLDLTQNRLIGLSSSIGRLGILKSLMVSENSLTGPLFDDWGSMSSLLVLNLTSNVIAGPIPPSIGSLPRLLTLDLSHNQLNGNIPPELGNLATAMEVMLNSNYLNGSIPSELSGLLLVSILRVDDNDLTGNVPLPLCQTLGGNQFYSDCDPLAQNGEINCPLGGCCTHCCQDGVGCACVFADTVSRLCGTT